MATNTRSMDEDVRLAINKHAGSITEENYPAIIIYKKAGRTSCGP